MNINKTKTYVIGVVSIIIGIILDQYTKFLAVAHLKEETIVLWENVFELHYLENRGAAFGMMQGQQSFFLITGCIMLLLGTVLYIRLPHITRYLPLRACIVLIISGAIGNMIDRMRLSYVVDFLYFKLIDFPIFNVADIYVTVAAILLILLVLFYYSEEEIDDIFKYTGRETVCNEK